MDYQTSKSNGHSQNFYDQNLMMEYNNYSNTALIRFLLTNSG